MTNLIGRRFGRLIVIADEGFGKFSKRHWICRCDCGKEKSIIGPSLVRGASTSCGCFRRETASKRFTTHGMSKSRTYHIWLGMKSRTSNPKDIVFRHYGGRGIKICKRWENSFKSFLEDMGEPPTNKHSIEREDNEVGYSKENCRWVTQKEQTRNTRNSLLLTVGGITKCASQWSEERGLHPQTLYARIRRGWTHERAVNSYA